MSKLLLEYPTKIILEDGVSALLREDGTLILNEASAVAATDGFLLEDGTGAILLDIIYYQSLSGILTALGSVLKFPQVKRSGTFGFSGVASKQTKILRAGVLAFTGAVARSKLTLKALAGTFGFIGALVKRTQIKRSGTLTATGSVGKYAQVKRAGVFTFAGTAKKTTRIARAGVLAFSGVAAKTTRILRAGALAFSGAVARGKLTVKALAGVLAFTGAVVGNKITAILVAVGGVLTFSGVALKRTSKSLAGSLAFSGALGKLTRKVLRGVLQFIGAIAAEIFGAPIAFLRLVTPADERIAVDGYAVAAFAFATDAEDNEVYLTPALNTLSLQCPPIGGPSW